MSLKNIGQINAVEQPKQRDSNLELFRIITMLLIVAHHYVVNSGLTASTGPIVQNQLSGKSLFYLLFGAWGKTGINCFVMITGYFMCKSKITVKKFLKLICQIYFYKIVIFIIFLFTGYEKISLNGLLKLVLPFTSLGQNFTGCYLVFYLCIPFLNILVNNMSEKQHRLLIILLVSSYTVFGSVFPVAFNYVTWFCVLYIVSSYIRLHPCDLLENTKLWLLLTIISVILSCCSVIGLAFIGTKFNKFAPFHLLNDSNKIFAFTTGVCSFLLFKKLKIKYNPFINNVAKTCFGVLLIHANSEAMRRWLWNDLLHNVEMYNSKYFAVHALVSVPAIFIVCSLIDWLRIELLEKNIFSGKREGKNAKN